MAFRAFQVQGLGFRAIMLSYAFASPCKVNSLSFSLHQLHSLYQLPKEETKGSAQEDSNGGAP